MTQVDVIGDLCVPLGERLWLTYRDEPTAPKLIFADNRAGIRRVSEQEARVLMCVLLEEAGWYYSVETPTAETYQQSGTYALSARADLTVHGSRRSSDRILNVEFKAGTPPVEVFRKDLEKLTREGIPGLWFHTLEKATPRTLATLAMHIRDAWSLLLEHGAIATHDIHFAICVLDPALLFSTKLTLGAEFNARLDAAFAEGLTGWGLHGPDATSWPPATKTAATPRASGQNRRGYERWLISCPQIAPDTLLHFNRQGDSYRLREFSLASDGESTCRTFLASHPSTGVIVDTADGFLRLFAPELVADVYDDRTPVANAGYWARMIAEQSARRAPFTRVPETDMLPGHC
ncbi:MAG: hypothetical protein ACSLFM_07810 [Tepidiformaceae bacterium]